MYSNTGNRNYENICIWLETLDKAEFGHQVCRLMAISVLYVLLGLKSRWLVKVGPWLLCFFELFYVPAIVLRCNTAVSHEMPGIPLGSDAMGGRYDVMAFSGVWLYFPASGFDICSSGCCCSVDALMQMHVWSSKGWSKVKLGYFYYVHDYRWVSMLFLNDEFTSCYFDRFNVIIASCLNTEFCGTTDTCQPSF